MKDQIDLFSKGIKKTALPCTSEFILSTAFIYIVEHLGESKVLLDLFI